MAKRSAAHPGFKAEEKAIASRPGFKGNAGAILAAGARKASPAAKKRNPRLKKVGGMPKRKKVKA